MVDKLLNLVPEIQRCCSMGEEQEGMLFTVLSVWSAGIALGVDLLGLFFFFWCWG